MKHRLLSLAVSVALAATVAATREAAAPPDPARIDSVFSRWTSNTPGCALGVARDGKVVYEKAYGLAELEHGVPNTRETIFEAGSVSKQFTAAAVLLLAHDGKLSLDDPARKYLPELPDYGKPLTIRQMLTHTSGLRDWGDVEAIAGWPRTSRVYTHAHVLDIVSRQKSLNFEPGTNWSYCNTGYNLAAIIVSRVSGMSFADFCRARIFEPLGMTHTSWRDDFRRIVKGRAVAYSEADGTFRQSMPFENVHGNGGLLTTVGDLLKWNENAVAPKVGNAEFLRQQAQPGRFNDGKPHNYAMGLYVGTFLEVLPEFSHSGSTAGYRAFLARYPDQHLSVAVLCNASSATAEQYAHDVARLYLRDAALQAWVAKTGGIVDLGHDDIRVPPLAPLAGLYRNTLTGVPLALRVGKPALYLEIEGAAEPGNQLMYEPGQNGMAFRPLNGSRTYFFEGGGRRIRVANGNGTTDHFEKVDRATPTAEELAELAGVYVSDEAETVLQVTMNRSQLVVQRRPATVLTLRPVYADAFTADGLGLIRFHRSGPGRVDALSVVVDRVWDMKFVRR